MLIYPRHLFTDSHFLQHGWTAWLPGEGPLNLEIGCGYGHFLIHMAQQFPQQRFIGLDLVNKILLQVSQQIMRAGLKNACVCKVDANFALRELFPDYSLDNIYIFFPDPWFKERRLKRRILRAETLPEIVRVLKPGGYLYFVTDDQDYAQAAQALLQSNRSLQAVPFPTLELGTKYERKWREQKKNIYRFCYQRQGHIARPASWPNFFEPVALQLQAWTPARHHMFWQYFKPRQRIELPRILKLMACYYEPLEQRLLLRSLFCQEGMLPFTFWLHISMDGILSLAPGSYLPSLRQRQQLLQEIATLIQTDQGERF